MADTENFGWSKPTVAGDNNAWGTKLNTLFDAVDADLQTVADALEAALAEIVTLNAAAEGGGQRTLFMSHGIFQPNSDDDDISVVSTGQYLQSDDDSGSHFHGSLTLPPGVVLDQVDLICDKNGRTSVSCAILSINSSTGSPTTLATGTRSASGVGAASAAAIAHTVTNSEILHLHVSGVGSSARYRIYGVKVLYTKSTILQSL